MNLTEKPGRGQPGTQQNKSYCRQIRGLIATASKQAKPALLVALANLLAKRERAA